MRKILSYFLLAFLLVVVFFVIAGSRKAALMSEINKRSMALHADTTNVSEFDSKLYEIAYSLPVGAEKVGLWLEAVLAKKFETFTSQSQMISNDLAKQLEGWPINYTVELDLSGSDTEGETIVLLGDLAAAEWIDLSRTRADQAALLHIIGNAPNLEKLQLSKTAIQWSPELVDAVLKHPKLLSVEIDKESIEVSDYNRLQQGLAKRGL